MDYALAKELNRERNRKNYRLNRERILAAKKAWQAQNPEKMREIRRLTHWRLKLLTLSKYGTNCACCGESEPSFLAIDHVNNDGAKERRENKQKKGGASTFYYWLKKNNWPLGYQVLCHNCNMAKAFYKVCPHILKGGVIVSPSTVCNTN